MNIGIIGTGNMGSVLGKLWAARGHKVLFGSRDPKKAEELAQAAGSNAKAGSYADAVKFGQAVLLATPWHSTQETIKAAGSFQGKILIDCTNPLLPDMSGIALGFSTSGAEEIAKWAPGAKVVKSFNSLFAGNIANPKFGNQNADQFYCGDDAEAKAVVAELGKEIGLNPVDTGALKVARYLEPLALLWVHMAWTLGRGTESAFKLIKR